MALTSSMEDYLEAVLILHQKHGSVRGVDIAVHLGVTKPSVSRAVKELSKSEYIVKNTDGTLSLTDSGLQIATQIYEKHQFFTRQLIEAGVPQDIAAQDACKLEHVISETSYKKLREAAWPGVYQRLRHGGLFRRTRRSRVHRGRTPVTGGVVCAADV